MGLDMKLSQSNMGLYCPQTFQTILVIATANGDCNRIIEQKDQRALGKLVLGKMALGKMALGKMALGKMAGWVKWRRVRWRTPFYNLDLQKLPNAFIFAPLPLITTRVEELTRK